MTGSTTSLRKFWLAAFAALGLLLLAVTPRQAAAQELPDLEECAGGTLYYFAFPDTTMNTFDARFPNRIAERFYVYVYSPVDGNKVSIGPAGGGGQNRTIDAGRFEEFDLSGNAPLVTEKNTKVKRAYKIESEFPVVVYCYMSTRFGNAAFTPIPVEAWGTDYYAAAFPGEVVNDVGPDGEFNYLAIPKEGPAEIMIIAAYDNTKVNIQPAGRLKDCFGCASNITLNAGDCYLVQSEVDIDPQNAGIPQQDLGGSYITSNKRIGVLSGNTRAQLNAGDVLTLGGNAFKDLMIEWVPPVEQHGTEFAYTPHWDRQRQTPSRIEETRQREVVRAFGTTGAPGQPTNVQYTNSLGAFVPSVSSPIAPGEVSEDRIGTLESRLYKASKPIMMMQAPEAVVKFNGTTLYWGQYVGSSYDGWSTSMVEMVPREQWTSFAPFRAPTSPADMENLINVIASKEDAAAGKIVYRIGSGPLQPFVFDRGEIPGSDLVWGAMSLTSGLDYYLEGKEGTRFTGYVYGFWKGYELYRPGSIERDDDDGKGSATAGAKDDDDVVLHPSEYEEWVAQAYAYPLAPSRCVLSPPDTFKVEWTQDCQEMIIDVQAINANPVGIRSISFERGSNENARIEFIDPNNPLALKETKVAKARVKVAPIDPRKDARGTILIKDRTRDGQPISVPYVYYAERVTISPADGIDFGSVTVNLAAGEQAITITNPLQRDITVRSFDLASKGNEEFVIVRTEPNFDWNGKGNPPDDLPDSTVLRPGESLRVFINITPTRENSTYLDSLLIELGCIELSVPLRAATVKPCLFVGDLDFGTLEPGQSATRNLEICNNGDGEVRFIGNTPGDPANEFVTWLETEFDVAPAEKAKLVGTVLGPKECVTIRVVFSTSPDATTRLGLYRDVARFWASTRDCRDTSIWTANVVRPGPQITGFDWKKRRLSSDEECTENDDQRYCTTVSITNTGTNDYTVENLELVNNDGRLAITNPGEVVSGKTVRPGETYDIEVCYTPMTEGQVTDALIRMSYRTISGETGYVENFLRGTGVEAYIQVTDINYGPHLFTTAGATRIPMTLTLTVTGSWDDDPEDMDEVEIRNIEIVDPNGNFENLRYQTRPNPIPNGTQPTYDYVRPGDVLLVDADFVPKTASPAIKNATVVVTGDFAKHDCPTSETDAVADLTGEVFTVGGSVVGHDFGTTLTCFEKDGVIRITNDGSAPIVITNVLPPVPADPSYFAVDPTQTITLPETLDAGEQLVIPVRYRPAEAGTHAATVEIQAVDLDGNPVTINGDAGINNAQLNGSSSTMTVNFTIDDGYIEFPGGTLDIPVTLDQDPGAARVSEFIVNLEYDAGMMQLEKYDLGALVPAGQGWELISVDERPGTLTVRIRNTQGGFLQGTGDVLTMKFITYIGSARESQLPFNVTPVVFGGNSNPCITFTTVPGYAALDSVCGLNFRLIEAISNGKFSVGQAVPNPATTATEVQFSIGLDGPTRVEVFNASGDVVAVLVDGYLQPGNYTVTWDVEDQPSGTYYYRINSGHWTESNRLVIQK